MTRRYPPLTRQRTLLVIEDDPAVRSALKRVLERRGFEVRAAASGPAGLRIARAYTPDLILLDWMLGSGPHGVDICASLKNFVQTRSIPIIILTGARVTFNDELQALRHGADLYLTKDAVLGDCDKSARFFHYVQSLLDRPLKLSDAGPAQPQSSLRIDIAQHTVTAQDEMISDLSTKLFDLLYILAKNHPRIVSRKYIVREIWNNTVQDREVDVAVCRLKARIEKGREEIVESVVKKGYRLRVKPSIVSGANPRARS